MIDHISIYAQDYIKTRNFYQKVFEPLGYRLVTEIITPWDTEFPTRRCCAFGPEDKTTFWVIETKEQYTPRHVAFSARNHQSVDTFYQITIESGADSNGTPGLRPEYHANYYGAFVFDPDGNDIEAVCHALR